MNEFRENIAWAAGFYDGEGSIAARKSVLTVVVSQKDSEVLYRFRDILKVGRIYPHRSSGGWQWATTSFEDGQATIAMLWPFLGSIKRQQCSTALMRVREYGIIHGHRNRNRFKGYSRTENWNPRLPEPDTKREVSENGESLY